MAEHFFRANEVDGAGFIHETGDAVIAMRLSDADEIQIAFPGDDIPGLMLLLSQIYAQNLSGSGVKDSLEYTTLLESAQFLPGSDAGAIVLIVHLSAGTPASFAMKRSVAVELRDQLDRLL